MILVHSYNLGLRINALWLWTLSFSPCFLLFQAVLCEKSFSLNVHVCISLLGKKMSVVDMFYENQDEIFINHRSVFSPSILLHGNLLLNLENFQNVFSLEVSENSLWMCIVMPLQQNTLKTTCIIHCLNIFLIKNIIFNISRVAGTATPFPLNYLRSYIGP